MTKKHQKSKSGQTMVEYIIIVLIIAVAALAVVGVFSDRVRTLFGVATKELGGETDLIEEALEKDSEDWLKDAQLD